LPASFATSETTAAVSLRALPVDLPASRSDFAEIVRQWRQRVVVVQADGAGPAPTAGLITAAAARPTQGPLAPDEGFMLGPIDGAYITGLLASTGMVFWAARSGGITLALLASVPIWRNLDPLYVLPTDRLATAEAPGEDENDEPAPAALRPGWRIVGRPMLSIDFES
jgi:hypothetical protein